MADSFFDPDKFDPDEFEHVDQHLEKMIEQAKFGKRITSAASSPTSPFGLMLAKARAGYLDSLKEFTSLDLFSENGLQNAQRCQATMARYADMVAWITSAVEAGIDAEEQLQQHKTDKVETEEMEQYYGAERNISNG